MAPAEQKVEAEKMYQEFFSSGGHFEVNVDMPVKVELRRKLFQGEISPTMMDEAESHCTNLLRYSVFPLWKESSAFKEQMKKHKSKDIFELKQLKAPRRASAIPEMEVPIGSNEDLPAESEEVVSS